MVSTMLILFYVSLCMDNNITCDVANKTEKKNGCKFKSQYLFSKLLASHHLLGGHFQIRHDAQLVHM